MIALSMKHLRYFDALAKIGHFGRAAEACAISQPALSLQIRELEELIGAPLVERGNRQIRLTALGEEFADAPARSFNRSMSCRIWRGLGTGRSAAACALASFRLLLPIFCRRSSRRLRDITPGWKHVRERR